MSDPAAPDDLAQLGARLDEAKARLAPDPKRVATSALGHGFRLGLELVSGVLVGAFVGWWLDRWLHTSPAMLLICFFLGLAAGFLNLWRAVKHEQALVNADSVARANDVQG